MLVRSREALIECLEVAGLSERELARIAPLGHATVNHLVTGRRASCSLTTAIAIERVFDVQPGTLFAAESELERHALTALQSSWLAERQHDAVRA
ncbi:MAG TPA: helix-turn-helix transcriptional regulator [Jatrophihabitans sp.]|nr:helix-turn-helix transcriptional regulator [Jatrophihabitans sp.]